MAAKRFAVQAINDDTGETWSIHDSKKACEAELASKLAAWGKTEDEVRVSRADISAEVEDDDPAPTSEPPVVAEGDGISDTVEG